MDRKPDMPRIGSFVRVSNNPARFFRVRAHHCDDATWFLVLQVGRYLRWCCLSDVVEVSETDDGVRMS